MELSLRTIYLERGNIFEPSGTCLHVVSMVLCNVHELDLLCKSKSNEKDRCKQSNIYLIKRKFEVSQMCCLTLVKTGNTKRDDDMINKYQNHFNDN